MEEHQFQFLLSFSFQNLSKLSCQWTIFILSAAFELFHSKVKQSTALESQDVLGWRVSWCCFNSCGDIDLCPEGRAEARLNSITYYKIAFRQLFSFSVSAGIVQNYLIFFPLLFLFSTERQQFQHSLFLPFPSNKKFQLLYTPILTSSAALSCN